MTSTGSGTMIWLWISPSSSPSRTQSRWFGDTRNIVEHRQPKGSSVTTVLSPRDLVGQPVDQVDLGRHRPGAAGRALRGPSSMMYSVEPLTSAACTTSNVHSGCATTLPVGYCFRNASICATVKRVWTEQWPFHRISSPAAPAPAQAAPHLVRIPHDHLVERHAHLLGGVAPEMLVRAASPASRRAPRPTS